MTTPAIDLAGVVRTFDEVTALAGVDLRVERGEVVGLLGHNGAGKTTTVRVLAGLLPADRGTVRVAGLDPQADGSQVRRTIGVLPARPVVDDRLTARRNLRFAADTFGLDEDGLDARIEAALETFELADRADERVRGFSTGHAAAAVAGAGAAARPADPAARRAHQRPGPRGRPPGPRPAGAAGPAAAAHGRDLHPRPGRGRAPVRPGRGPRARPGRRRRQPRRAWPPSTASPRCASTSTGPSATAPPPSSPRSPASPPRSTTPATSWPAGWPVTVCPPCSAPCSTRAWTSTRPGG